MVQAKTMTYTVATSVDDTTAMAGSSGYNQDNMYVPYSSTDRRAMMRWSIRIPKGATITSAYVDLHEYWENQTNAAYADWNLLDYDSCGELWAAGTYALNVTADNCGGSACTSTYSDTLNCISSYSGSDWCTSSDLAGLVTAFLARGGYAYSNYLGLRAQYSSGSYYKQFSQYDELAANAPKLIITYTGGNVITEIWAAPPYQRTKQYVYVQLYNQDAGDKLYVYLDNVAQNMVGQSSSPYVIQAADVPAGASTRKEFVYLLDYTGLSAATHHIDVTVTTSADVARTPSPTEGENLLTWATLHSGYPKVGIDENNSWCVSAGGIGAGCTPYFPMTAYWYDSAHWYDATDAFVSAINGLNVKGDTVGDIGDWSTTLHKAAEKGLTHWGPLREAGWPKDVAKLATNSTDCGSGDGHGAATAATSCSYVNYTKNHPAVFAWNWHDEPTLAGDQNVTAAEERTLFLATKANDTNHPMYVQHYSYDYTTGGGRSQTEMLKWHFLTNAGNFSNVRTWLHDAVGGDYYVYEKFGKFTNTVSLVDNLEFIDNQIAWDYNMVPNVTMIEPQDETTCQSVNGTCAWAPTNWAANTVYAAETYVKPTSTPTSFYRCIVGGTSHASTEPTWANCATEGQTCTDGTVTWKNHGLTTQSWGTVLGSDVWTPDQSPAQMKNLAWLTAIHGSKGLHFFGPDFWAPTRQVIIDELVTFKTALAANSNLLLFALYGPLSTKVTQFTVNVTDPLTGATIAVNMPHARLTSGAGLASGDRLDYTVREYGGKVYVFAARVKTQSEGWPSVDAYSTATATFTLTGLSGTRTATKKLGSGSVSVAIGVFSDTFTDYGVEVYEIGDVVGAVTLGTGAAIKMNVGAGFMLQ